MSVYLCIYFYIYVYVYVSPHIYIYKYIHVYKNTYTITAPLASLLLQPLLNVLQRLYTYICTDAHTHIHTHTYAGISPSNYYSVYIDTYAYIPTYIYIQIPTQSQRCCGWFCLTCHRKCYSTIHVYMHICPHTYIYTYLHNDSSAGLVTAALVSLQNAIVLIHICICMHSHVNICTILTLSQRRWVRYCCARLSSKCYSASFISWHSCNLFRLPISRSSSFPFPRNSCVPIICVTVYFCVCFYVHICYICIGSLACLKFGFFFVGNTHMYVLKMVHLLFDTIVLLRHCCMCFISTSCLF